MSDEMNVTDFLKRNTNDPDFTGNYDERRFPEQCRTCGNRYICEYLNCMKEKPCRSYIPDNDDWMDSTEELRSGN